MLLGHADAALALVWQAGQTLSLGVIGTGSARQLCTTVAWR
jgi:hypothetical protein